MEPISVALLGALAGGAGGELGRQLWAGLSGLVQRPFRRNQDDSRVPAVSSGEVELARLTQTPSDVERAQALSTALAMRAAADAGFHTALQQWHEQAKLMQTRDGDVHITLSGGTFHGPAIVGRDFSGITFTTQTPLPSPDPHAATPSAQE